MMIKITELDELLNTLATSALEPHEEYKMEFSNREQKLIYEYIKSLQQENQQLKEQNECLLNQKNNFEYIQAKTLDDMDKKNKQLKQRDEVIDEAIQELISSKEYQMAIAMELNDKQSVLIRLSSILKRYQRR